MEDVVLGAEQKGRIASIFKDLQKHEKEKLSPRPKISVRFLPRVHGETVIRFFEGAGWMRLLLFILHDSFAPDEVVTGLLFAWLNRPAGGLRRRNPKSSDQVNIGDLGKTTGESFDW